MDPFLPVEVGNTGLAPQALEDDPAIPLSFPVALSFIPPSLVWLLETIA
jgi:hypothetical protein